MSASMEMPGMPGPVYLVLQVTTVSPVERVVSGAVGVEAVSLRVCGECTRASQEGELPRCTWCRVTAGHRPPPPPPPTPAAVTL